MKHSYHLQNTSLFLPVKLRSKLMNFKHVSLYFNVINTSYRYTINNMIYEKSLPELFQ